MSLLVPVRASAALDVATGQLFDHDELMATVAGRVGRFKGKTLKDPSPK